MTCVMPMLVNKGSTSTKEERKTMVDTFLCGASKNTRRIIIKFMTLANSMVLKCNKIHFGLKHSGR